MTVFRQNAVLRIFPALIWMCLICRPCACWGAGTGVIEAAVLNVRSGPGTDFPPVTTVRKGTRVEVLDQDKGWLKIQHREITGWVKNRERYIRLQAEQPPDGDVSRSAGKDIDAAKAAAETLRRQIQDGQAEVTAFSAKETEVIDRLDDLNRALSNAATRRRALEEELAEAERSIAQTREAIDALAQRIESLRGYAMKRLVALYKLDRIGRIHLIASATSFYELFQRESTLEHILAHDRQLLSELAQSKSKLQKLLDAQQARKAEKVALEADLNRQVSDMRQKKSRRENLLKEIRSKKSLQLAALEALKHSARELDKKIKMLSLQQVQTEPEFNLPDRPFAELKGLLKIPVKGKIISKFGPYKNHRLNVMNFRNGVDIRADRGEPVRAVFAGKIVFADWFRGYGNMIIIDHGNKFHTVYANIEELFKKVGDHVQAGEVVATVGDAGPKTRPVLHFEIRHDRKPVDPLDWVDSG